MTSSLTKLCSKAEQRVPLLGFLLSKVIWPSMHIITFEARVPLLQFVLVDGIDFGPNAELCANCGRLWSQTDLEKAGGFIEAYGSDTARAILAERFTAHDTPPRTPLSLMHFPCRVFRPNSAL
jgi:hypothetical protein